VSAQAVSSWEEIGARVATARKSAGLTQEGLAHELGLDRTAVTRIESGQRELDARELAHLSSILGRPLPWFLSLPDAALAGRRASLDASVPHRIDDLLEDLADGVGQLTELGLLNADPFRVTGDLVSFEDAERAANETRSRIGQGSGPLWDLTRVAESLGLFACSLRLQDDRVDGAYAVLDGGGVAVVNGDFESGRRRFTLAHEIGHHVLQDKYAEDRDIAGNVETREKLINAFAIHFLMPRGAVVEQWKSLNAKHGLWDSTLRIGVQFGVSWTALCLQLKTLGLIDDRAHEVLVRRKPVGADYLERGLDLREDLHPPRIPPSYGAAVVKAYRGRRIGRSRAVELLFGASAASDLSLKRQPLGVLRSEFGSHP
jgi:Zn-dependent peptidase ImmA (M78 family)/DNA-binding XRE family transcriptional regulator